jgi:hypothetical protein
MSTMWTGDGQDPRTYGNPQGEQETYVEYLHNYRLTLGLKCEGLTPEQLATRSVPPSTMSLLGLVRHMAAVEHSWFQRVAQATGEDRLYRTEEDRDLDFNGAVGTQECVDDAFATWRREIAKAEQWFDAVDEADLGREMLGAARHLNAAVAFLATPLRGFHLAHPGLKLRGWRRVRTRTSRPATTSACPTRSRSGGRSVDSRCRKSGRSPPCSDSCR